MKHTPPEEFENAKPAFDYRDHLSHNQSLPTRFAKAVINSKFMFRSVLTSSLALAGVAAADITWGSHDLRNIAECDIVYNENMAWFWQTPHYQRMRAHIDTEKHTMIDVFHECGRFLNTMDGDDRIFIDYTSNSGIAIPGIELIEGSPIDVGLHGAQLPGSDPQTRLEEAIALNKSDQRWLVENYIRVAGQTYSYENFQFRINQAQYAVSDKIKYTLWDMGDWFNEQRQEFSNEMDRLWARVSPFQPSP